MKKLLLPLFLLICYAASAQSTINWDGGGDGTTWEDRFNWDLDRVPDATDYALIQTTTADLNIVVTTENAVAASLEIFAFEFKIDFTIEEDAKFTSIDLTDLFGDALYGRTSLNGELIFTNNGEMILQKSGSSDSDYGVYFFSGGGVGRGPGSMSNRGGTWSFINNGDIYISDVGDSGFYLEQNSPNTPAPRRAIFENNGFIEVLNSATDDSEPAFVIEDEVDGSNSGTFILDTATYSMFEIDDGASFINDGFLQIKGLVSDELFLFYVGSFTNNGLIQLEAVNRDPSDGPEAAFSVFDDVTIINSACAVINIGEELYIDIEDEADVSNAGIITSAYPGTDPDGNVGPITNTGEIRTPDGMGNGLTINGGSVTDGPIPAEGGLSNSCPPLPEPGGDDDDDDEVVTEELPFFNGIWAKVGFSALLLSLLTFLLYYPKTRA